MAESEQGGNTPGQPPKELSMELRLLLAFLLMGAVMFVTPYFYKPEPPAKKAPAPGGAPAAVTTPAAGPKAPAEAPPAEAAGAKPADAEPAPGATPQHPEPVFVIDTRLFRVVFNNQGATVRSWLLKKYKGNDDKLLELTNSAAGLDFPFSLAFPAQQPTAKVNWVFYTQTPDPDGLGVVYAWSDGHTAVRKTFRFQPNSYLAQVATEVTLDGQPLPHLVEWRGGFGDLTTTNPANSQRTLHFNVTDNKLVEQNAGAAKSGPVTASGNFSFAGVAARRICLAVRPRPDEAPRPGGHIVTDAGRWLELPADRLEDFSAVAGADILIAPLARVQRGVNIIGEGDRSALGSVWLIVRPIPVIDEPAELVAHLQARALGDHPGPAEDPLPLLRARRDSAGQYFEEIVRRPPYFQAQPREVKLSVTAEIINNAIQLIGRARRGGTPAVLHLADGAFLDPQGGTDFATLIAQLRSAWAEAGVLEQMRQLYGTTLEAFFDYADRNVPAPQPGAVAPGATSC